MSNRREEILDKFGNLLDVMSKLRSDCPWNHAQTNRTLRPMTIEEVYELSDAVLKESDNDIKKELGDVLFHVVFYSKLGEENGKYDIGDVIDAVTEKMVSRHPHVFAAESKMTAEEVSENWELIKSKEKGGNKRILSGIPDSMPTILKAYSMQDKARGVGFDWEEKFQVWDKVREEMKEFEEELESMSEQKGSVDVSVGEPSESSSEEFKAAYYRAEAELGDLLFAVINAARLYGLNPDTALNRTCEKFRRRFTYLEEQTIRKGRDLKSMTLREMDEIWDAAKKQGL